jgi:hypothetical protein
MEDVHVLLNKLLAKAQKKRDIFHGKTFLLQLHHPHEGLHITPDRDDTVMGLPGDLVISGSGQPTTDNQRFVALTPAYSLQVTPSRQIHTLLLQRRAIAFDGPNRDVQNPSQVFLAGRRPLGQGFSQQSLDTLSSKCPSTVLLTNLIVFLTSMNRPDDLFRRRGFHRPTMTGFPSGQDNPHLPWFQLPLAQQTALSIAQDSLRYPRRLAKFILQEIHKALFRRLGLLSRQLCLIHFVTSS